jgi:hypothetical protein
MNVLGGGSYSIQLGGVKASRASSTAQLLHDSFLTSFLSCMTRDTPQSHTRSLSYSLKGELKNCSP